MNAVRMPGVTGVIFRSGGLKTRFKLDRKSGDLYSTKLPSVVAKISDGRFGVYGGGIPRIDFTMPEGGDLAERAESKKQAEELIVKMAKENPEVYEKTSKNLDELDSHPMIKLILFQLAIEAAEHNIDPNAWVIWGQAEPLGALIEANPALALSKNAGQLRMYADIFLKMTMKSLKIHEVFASLVIGGIRRLLNHNPELAKIENLKSLIYLLHCGIKDFSRKDSPAHYFSAGVIAAMDGMPILARAENIRLLKKALKLTLLASDFNDHDRIRIFGIKNLLERYRSLTEKEKTEILGYLLDIALKALDHDLNPGYLFLEVVGEIEHTVTMTIAKFDLIKPIIERWLSFGIIAAEHGFDPKIVNKLALRPLIGLFWAEPEGENAGVIGEEAIHTCEDLMRNDLFPTPVLIDDLRTGKATITGLKSRLRELETQGIDSINIEDKTDFSLFMTIMNRRTMNSGAEFTPEDFIKMTRAVFDWQKNNPGYCALKNEIPTFTISGKGEVVISDLEFDENLINKHVNALTQAITGFSYDYIQRSPLSGEERSWYIKRVLAHLEVSKAMKDGKLPKGFVINSVALKRHILERRPENFTRSDDEMMRAIDDWVLKDRSLFWLATYFVLVSSLADAKNRKEMKKVEFFEVKITELLLSHAWHTDDQLMRMLHYGGLREKLEAFAQIYQDRVRHIPDLSVPMPKEVEAAIRQKDADLKKEYEKIGRAMKQANVQEYTIVPAGMEALFRGYIGADCSKSSNVALWAFNPNNRYLLIKKGEKTKGYIGLTKCKTSDGRKLILVDTMQPCPPGLLEPILRALTEIFKKLGYDGLAISRELDSSFNYEEVKNAIRGMKAYTDGKKTALQPEDENSWNEFENKLGPDDYHSLDDGGEYIVLKF